ncbi:uncharacterized protein MKZ38_007432 [Zalerion maritima]|uniref:Exocyst complex component Sec3 PIP2-binding N-terminal domain-containing protein n=1 Tax=Zalerion maritima TaxID=339359 RepID=A0AAD5RWS5_9PEZI|nr:uncharacterized protein MKZ38_007432 [Zalerion maritima]
MSYTQRPFPDIVDMVANDSSLTHILSWTVQETYITHIRITEYATHPSSPPPPEAQTRQNQKARIVIVAVKKSGRVRMHKSKENANGTFSIGKTWSLEDLKIIESFTGSQNPDRAAHAGNTGFIVTIGKSYFWHAQAEKEKRFFIASLIKIYGKYTGGAQPELIGFDQRELDQVTGAAATGRRQQQAPPVRAPPPDLGARNISVSSTSSGPRIGYSRDMPSAASPQSAIAPDFQSAVPSSLQQQQVPLRQPQPQPSDAIVSSPAGSIDSSRAGNNSFDSGRPSQNRDPSLRRLASRNKSQDSIANSFATKSDDGSSIVPPTRRNGGMRFGEPIQPPPDVPKDERPPERRRPPMDPTRPQNGADRDLVPAPLIPGQRKEPYVPPRSNDRMSPRKERVELSPEQKKDLRSELGSFKEKISQSQTPEPAQKLKPTERLQKLSPSAAPSASVTPNPPVTPNPTNDTTTPKEGPPKLTLAGVLRKAVEVAKQNGGEVGSPASPGGGTQPTSPKSPSETLSPVATEEEDRPGLGPMIKQKSKGDIAGAFWKAATVAGVFKPRAGGAMDQIRKAQSKSDGPDGITSVVPAPPKPAPTPDENRGSIPDVKVTVPGSSRPGSVQPQQQPKDQPQKEEEVGRAFTTGNDEKYLQALGMDVSILDKSGKEFTHWLDYFHWVPGDDMRGVNFEDVKTDLERETNKAQAGGWVARFQEEDERVDAIKSGLDVSMAECDELDNLLTLYSVELATLQDDIAYIEAQGQGLQVQAANQKTLQKELKSLLDTCAISARDLEALRMAPLEEPQGLETIEHALVTLYKAMHKIDPATMVAGDARDDEAIADEGIGFDSDFGKMRIVREKKAMYTEESSTFLRRLIDFLGRQTDDACKDTRRRLHDALSKKADPQNHEVGRDMLWMYSPVLLYARDIDLDAWNRALQVYQDKSHPLYAFEFREAIDAWKRYSRKMSGEEEYLFTAIHERHEPGSSSLATTARKLTVKRSQNLARSLRGGESSSKVNLDKTDNRSLPYEVFGRIADDLLPMVEMEQNFIIDLFHATTLEQADFPDAVAAARPQNRRGGDLRRHRLMEPDRELARRVTRAMETVFAFLEQDLQALIEWVASQDRLQCAGVLAAFERKQAETAQTNQDFLNNMLGKLHASVIGRFNRLVDDQVRAIEETKVKINKRRGVIGFIRIFPNFSSAVENMLSHAGGGDGTHENTQAPGARKIVDSAYDRIVKTMFDSLKVIARENPSAQGFSAATGHLPGASGGDEDKESLNFNILLIENMNHYVEETETRNLPVLTEWRNVALQELNEHMELYLNTVMRRPLGRLLEHMENIETQMGPGGKSPVMISSQSSTSKSQFNKVMSQFDVKDIRKGVEQLRKRVEKHFGDADDPALSKGLVAKVFREAERFYGDVETRIGRITTEVYGGDVLFEWPRAEVKAAFQAMGR